MRRASEETAEPVHVSFERVAELLDDRAALAITLVDGVGLSIEFVAATLGKTEVETLKIVASARERRAGLLHERATA